MRTLGLTLAITLLLAAPAAADNPWSAPASLPAVPEQPGFQQSSENGGGVVDADGTVAAVWIASRTVWTATRPAGGEFGTPTQLAGGTTGATFPSFTVVATPGGDAIAVWSRVDPPTGQPQVIEYSVRPPGGTFGPVRTLHTGGFAMMLDAAVNADGVAVVTWINEIGTERHVLAASRPAGGAFGDAQDLGTNGLSPAAAVSPDGSAEVAWLSGVSTRTIQASLRPTGSATFGAPRTLDTSSALAQPFTAAGSDGEITTLWYRRSGRSHLLRYSVRRSGSGAFTAAVNLGNAPTRRYGIAGGPDGDVAAVWADTTHGSVIDVRHRPAGHGFARARVLTKATNVGLPNVVEDADARMTVIWTRAASSGSRTDLYTATQKPAGGTIGPTRLDTQIFFGPAITAGVNGRAVAVWLNDLSDPPRYSVRG